MKRLFFISVFCLLCFSNLLLAQNEPKCAAPALGGSINLSQEGGIYLTSSGTIKVLIVFVSFKDDNSSHPYWPVGSAPQNYSTFIDPDLQTGSTHYINLTNYFDQMSFGVYKVIGQEVYVEAPHTKSYYGSNYYLANEEVLQQKVDPIVNFSDFDNWSSSANYTHSNQSDGTVDMIIMIWRTSTTSWFFDPGWSGIADLGRGSSYTVENGTKTIKTSYGSINSGSGVTLHYWGQRTPERNFKNAVHEMGHWLLGRYHPYNDDSNDEHKIWGILTRGDDGICANTYERERLAWINPTSITGNILNAPFQDYVEYGTSYKYHPSNGATDENFYFENHQKLSIYDNATNNTNDKGIFVIHQQGVYNESNNIRIKTSNGQWDWQNTGTSTCFGSASVPKFKPVSVNRSGRNNKDKILKSGSGAEWLFYLDNSEIADWPSSGCGDWLNGGGVNNAFNTTYNNVFSNYSNPWARRWTNDATNNFTMEITGQSGSVVNARYYITSPLDGKPSKPEALVLSAYADQHGDRPKLTWAANLETDLSLYEIWRKSSSTDPWVSCVNEQGWQSIGTTTSTSYIDYDGFYLSQSDLCLLEYKIRAKDTQAKYSLYSGVVSSDGYWLGWKRVAQEQVKESPLIFQLNQNYPNPFNPSTRIKYSIKDDGLVTIKIFDMLGKEIALLVNEFKPAGNHTIDFNASDLSSGVYLYSITSGKFHDLKKMILLR